MAYVKCGHFNQSKLVLSINKDYLKGKLEKHELAIFSPLAISCPYQRLKGCFSFSNGRLRKDFNNSQIKSTLKVQSSSSTVKKLNGHAVSSFRLSSPKPVKERLLNLLPHLHGFPVSS